MAGRESKGRGSKGRESKGRGIKGRESNLTVMRPVERLLAVLSGKAVDRAPVVKPGFLSVSLPGDVTLPAGLEIETATRDWAALAGLCEFVQRETGVECLALPFTMTVESEAYGGETERVGAASGRHAPPLKSLSELGSLRKLDPATDGRLPVVTGAVRALSKNTDGLPVIGELVGPLSLATSLTDGRELYKALVKDRAGALALLDLLVEGSQKFLVALVEAGADVVAITDPAASPSMLGGELLTRFSLDYINRLTGVANDLGVPVIVHLCGALDMDAASLRRLGAECLSVDSGASIEGLKGELPCRIMGGVSVRALSRESTDEVRREVLDGARAGVDILAPSCGLGLDVRAGNFRALVKQTRSGSALVS